MDDKKAAYPHRESFQTASGKAGWLRRVGFQRGRRQAHPVGDKARRNPNEPQSDAQSVAQQRRIAGIAKPFCRPSQRAKHPRYAKDSRCDVRDYATCTGCGACLTACAHNAMRMEADAEGFLYPRIDWTRCARCGACRAICPVDRASPRPWQEAHAALCTDDALRAASSSGGVFTALAEDTLARGGIVFGAVLQPAPDGGSPLRVCHIAAETSAELAALRGSKYVQSDLAATYKEAKTALSAGRDVLYTGTPCQIAGLYAALKKPYDRLLSVDLVCHGAPSPMAFAAYQRRLQAQHSQPIRALSFRDKRRGWKDFCLAATFADGSQYAAGQTEDPYLIAFLRNLCLRPSCHACPYAGEKRQADLTLADLWGAQRLFPDMDDDLGLSLVLAGSAKGAQALKAASPLRTQPVDPSACVRDNPSLCRSSISHPRRDAFLRHVRRRGFEGVEKKFFTPPSLLRRGVGKARRVLGKLFRKRGLS